MAVHAVILGGGAGSRLGGVAKWQLRIAGQRVLDRVTQRLDGIAGPILFATGPEPLSSEAPAPLICVGDHDPRHRGPLAGLAAAIRWLREHGHTTRSLISVAVDTPFLPSDFVARLLAALEGAPVAYASFGDSFYPTNAAWRLESMLDLPELIDAPDGPTSPKALQRRLGAVAVDWSATQAANPFVNINTLADLVALQKRALG